LPAFELSPAGHPPTAVAPPPSQRQCPPPRPHAALGAGGEPLSPDTGLAAGPEETPQSLTLRGAGEGDSATAQPGQLSPSSSPLPLDSRGVAPRCLRSSAHSLYLYDGVGNGVLSAYLLLTDLKKQREGGTGGHSQALLLHTPSPFCSKNAHRRSPRHWYLSRSLRSVSRSDDARWLRS